MKAFCLTFLLLILGASSALAGPNLPSFLTASNSGWTEMYTFNPTTNDIAFTTNADPTKKLYAGEYYTALFAPTNFINTNGCLGILYSGTNLPFSAGGGYYITLCTVPQGINTNGFIAGKFTSAIGGPGNFQLGPLPLLPGFRGWYIACTYKLSDAGTDHWGAFWALPYEHPGSLFGNNQLDHYLGDPPGYERYLECDVVENGFGVPIKGTSISWFGTMPNIYNTANPYTNTINETQPDISQWHTYGARYTPPPLSGGQLGSMVWYLDGVAQNTNAGNVTVQAPNYSTPLATPIGNCVPAVAIRQNMELLISARSQGANTPYVMVISNIDAWIGSGIQLSAQPAR